MTKNRDNFSKATTEVLAKRVGYLCSNPNCRQLTIGANEKTEKSTSIGIAAHITAASVGGPRYDTTLTTEERCHIDNGILLCGNCSILIDKDPSKYPIDTLKQWKTDAEEETRKRLNGEYKKQTEGTPFLEADLIWTFGGRQTKGYSNKNPTEIENGRTIYLIGSNPIVHWSLNWKFSFIIYNNSNYPALNIEIESIGTEHFTNLDQLPKINNLSPLKNINLKAKYTSNFEGVFSEADKILSSKIPLKFNDLKLKIKYLDNSRKEHITYVEFLDGKITNRKE